MEINIKRIIPSRFTDKIAEEIIKLERPYLNILVKYVSEKGTETHKFPQLNTKGKEYYKRIVQEPDVYMCVAIDKSDQKVVGYLYAKTMYEYDDLVSPPFIEIFELVVDWQYRGKGIGKLLLVDLEKYALERKIKLVQLAVHEFNSTALEFYTKNHYNTLMRKMYKLLTS